MHLTPEQIDRQPFRMTRRGYDIVQVRDFLREIATEMRERQAVRDRLDDAHDGNASAEAFERGEQRAAEIIAQAEADAEALAEEAEERARQRSSVVLAEAQTRLDELLAEEQRVRERIERQKAAARVAAPPSIGFAPGDPLADSRDRGSTAAPDTSLADFMKSTLRQEVTPD